MDKSKKSGKKKIKKNKSNRNFCVNPYKDHKKRRTDLREITSAFVEKAHKLNITLQVKEHICQTCYKKVNEGKKLSSTADPSQPGASGSGLTVSRAVKRKRSTTPPTTLKKLKQSGNSSSDMDISDNTKKTVSSASSSGSVYDEHIKENISTIVEKLNDIFKDTHVTSIDKTKIRYKKYSQDKLNEITEFLSKYVFKVENPSTDSNEMISQLKKKFASVSSRNEKIKILSVLPESWKPSKIQEHFNVPKYMAKQVKEIVKTTGTILCGTEKKLGSNKLDDAIVNAVQEFYREDISRICPGMRDYVTVNDEGKKETKQRRLVLMNLKEAYVEFKKKFPDYKIGFSKFAELRPAECVLALENYGTHSTCVCQYHQNFKLTLTALQKIKIFDGFGTFHQLLESVMCSQKKNECHIGECQECEEILLHTVKKLQEDLDEQMLDAITFMQWTNSPGKSMFIHIII